MAGPQAGLFSFPFAAGMPRECIGNFAPDVFPQ